MLMKTDGINLLPHNEMLYNKIIKELVSGKRKIFYSEATGLGKSFIFMKLVKEVFADKRILYIVPKNAVWENLVHYEEFEMLNKCNIDYKTFASFNNYDSYDEELSSYDVVFVDECHHMLSEIQGSNVSSYLNDVVSKGGYAFGMTATPYFNGEFVDEKYFSTACYGYDILEAIDCGLFPKIDMALADINLDEVPNDLKAQFSITGTKSLLEQILDDYADVSHWLAYFTNKEELESNYNELCKLFPDYKILRLHEGCGKSKDIIKEFEETNGKVILLSISMLLEGMHLKHVGGVLLYRNVVTDSTYLQIYGRLCKLGAKKSPVFVDITNSILNIKNVDRFKSSLFTGERKSYTKKDLFDITSRGYRTIELSEVMSIFNGKGWTEEEDSILKELYPTYGSDIVDKLPSRTKSAIRARAFNLGIIKDDAWTEDEDSLIREFYPSEGSSMYIRLSNRTKQSVMSRAAKIGVVSSNYLIWSDEEESIIQKYFIEEGFNICNRLPNRTWIQIRHKANSLGFKLKCSSVWSEEEDEILRKYYIAEGLKVSERLSTEKTKSAIRARATKLGLARRDTPKAWSEEEIELLKDNLNCKAGELCLLFPNRTRASVLNMRGSIKKDLGIDRSNGKVFEWSDELDSIIKEYYPIIGSACYNLIEGASKNQVCYRAKQLGLSVVRVEWSKEEDDILHQYYCTEGINVKGRLNNKTENQILYRVNKLNVKTKSTRKGWCIEDDNILLTLYNNGRSLDEISTTLGRTKPAIQSRLQSLGVSKNARWTEDELLLLSRNMNIPIADLAILFKRHNEHSITRKLKELKRKDKSVPDIIN